ncbi:related to RTA1 domain protein [Phialocephala subalpina]|uniref:Related to RTA1 domain protein n=1 Tax=Phialocephala subalpina TaxID=576137 RepID=A0A1L7XCJ6_9HELO|nr:related to RTA1 domain protein [Phialocephala subalpina]
MDVKFNSTTGAVELYSYVPAATPAWAFIGLFAVGTFAHFIALIPLRAPYFIPLIIGGICESFGYYGRVWSSRSPHLVKPFVLQNLLILTAPVFIAATIYMSLSRLIRALNAEHLSPIKTKLISRIFILTDILCFCTQIGGAGVQITGDANIMRIGNIVVLCGLVFQICMFVWFLSLARRFHIRLQRDPTRVAEMLRWGKFFWALYVVGFVVLLRNMVRVIEFAEGEDGFVKSHEAMLYVFDAFLMCFVVYGFGVVHPSWLVRKARRAELSLMARNSLDTMTEILVPREEGEVKEYRGVGENSRALEVRLGE